jgi:ubiquinone/menaquinone biosynthesis C-methylase UbiE
MVCHGGFSLPEETRRSWYNPEAILQDLAVGMVFVDVGCGEGFFSMLAAKKVGAKGKVYAVDIDPKGIEKLKQKAETECLNNIDARVGRAEETVFCKKCGDFVFFSMDLHDFGDPAKVLENARQMLKPKGRLVDLDWKKKDVPFGPPAAIRFSEEKASRFIENAGFKVLSIKDAGKYHYVVTAQPLP